MDGALKKLVITAYSDPELTTGKKVGEYTTMLNPEKYSFQYKAEYQEIQASGESDKSLQYIRSLPADLDLEFLFDRTGIFGPVKAAPTEKEKNDGVEIDIREFKNITFNYNGDIHKPNYLKINWGTLDFSCILSELNIEYKLFAPNGMPLRAIAKAKFKTFENQEKIIAKQNKKSPDLTHSRIVVEGDTLPLMTFRIYGDSKYYLEVAKANKLTTFRKLKAGQIIVFPPIQKPS